MGSSDNCVEIAESFGAKILHHELVPFAEHVRNFAIKNAKNNWVLFADPDMYFPVGIGEKIDNFITTCSDNIGVIHIPARKYFKNQPILYGIKGEIESRAALIDTNKVDFLPLVHYGGIQPKESVLTAGLLVNQQEFIEHYWVDSMKEAVEKARRYIPFEGESRHQRYKGLKIKPIAREFIKLIFRDLKMGALKSKLSFHIMVFNIWYFFGANIQWIKYELALKRSKEK